MMRKSLAALALLIALCLPAAAWGEENPWKKSPGKDRFPKASTIVLKDVITYIVKPDGGFVLGEHEVIKALDRAGVEMIMRTTRPYFSDTQEVVVDLARVFHQDGTVETLKGADITDVVPAMVKNHPLYGRLHYKTIMFKNLKPGGVIEYKLRHIRKKGYPERQVWGVSFTQDHDPVLSSTFIFQRPRSFPVRFKVIGHKDARPVTTYSGRDVISTWTVKDRPVLPEEAGMPPLRVSASRIEATTFRSWDKFADWFRRQWHTTAAEKSRLKALAAGLFKATDTEEMKIEKIQLFMAGKKLVHLHLPSERWRHNPLSSLYNQTLLDEMDKAALCAGLLEIAGFRVRPALISTEDHGRIDRTYAFPEDFDYILLVVEDRKGLRWLDPDARGGAGGDLSSSFQGSDALVLLDRGHALTVVPSLPSYANREEFTFEGTLNEAGDLEGSATFEEYGGFAAIWRYYLRSVEPGTESHFANMLLMGLHPGAEVLDYYIPTEQEKNFKLTLSFEAPGFAQKVSSFLRFRAPLYSFRSLYGYATLPARTFPIVLGAPCQLDRRVHITLPGGSSAKLLPKNISLEEPFASFQLECSEAKGQLWIYSRLSIKKREISVKEYAKFKKLVDGMGTAERFLITLQKERKVIER
jgi:hypothetical protein